MMLNFSSHSDHKLFWNSISIWNLLNVMFSCKYTYIYIRAWLSYLPWEEDKEGIRDSSNSTSTTGILAKKAKNGRATSTKSIRH